MSSELFIKTQNKHLHKKLDMFIHPNCKNDYHQYVLANEITYNGYKIQNMQCNICGDKTAIIDVTPITDVQTIVTTS